jgi:hypothetical protein
VAGTAPGIDVALWGGVRTSPLLVFGTGVRGLLGTNAGVDSEIFGHRAWLRL